MPDVLNPDNVCMFLNDHPDEFPKVIDGQLITILSGPFDTEEACFAAGPPCACTDGLPALAVTMVWTDTAIYCKEFLDLTWKRGETKQICPDNYARYREYDPFIATWTPVYGGGAWFAKHDWAVDGGTDKLRLVRFYDFGYYYPTFGGFSFCQGRNGNNAINFKANGNQVDDYLAAFGNCTGWTNTFSFFNIGLINGVAIPSYNDYELVGAYFGSHTVPDPASAGNTITYSWAKGTGDWVTPTDPPP